MGAVAKLKKISIKSRDSIASDGLFGFGKRAALFAYYRKYPERKKKCYKDILIINGCALEAPTWYRVDHQMEQLKSCGLSVDTVFYDSLSLDMLAYYRGFIFFRCPITETVGTFIQTAKHYNKTCLFDIDDLVIDTKYTDQNKYVASMQTADKALYDDGVRRMRETLQLCDAATTTTAALKQELLNYCPEVYINRNVASDEIQYHSQLALKNVVRDSERVVIGYFSGSITHNEDFELVLPSLKKILDVHPNVYLKVTGILDIPKELEVYKERIIGGGFYQPNEFQGIIASCDIAIAPLTDSIFNAAKSENKWLLPSLVKVPTVASNLGAFREVVEDRKTGVLVNDNEWFDVLNELILNRNLREDIGRAAYEKVSKEYITVYSGRGVSEYIRSKLARNIAFFLPSTDISGGVTVALKHADILRRSGWDVTIIDAIDKRALNKAHKEYHYRTSISGYNVVTACKTKMDAFFDSQVATLWSTLDIVKAYPNVKNRIYFVQGFETDFSPPGTGKQRFEANATYCDATGVRYVTMSPWCKKWLKESFGQDARYAPNGIDIEHYPYRKRDFSGKIKILIEGDSKSEMKNTDEAFRIVEKLDPEKYEISYLSYRKEPKSWYRVDAFYNRISPDKVGEVYASCDILIKTSLLESFSYPPLEMMATGGIAIVLPNDGNIEYLKDGENCLLYPRGDISAACAKIEEVVKDASLRSRLCKNGRKTASDYRWTHVEDRVRALYL